MLNGTIRQLRKMLAKYVDDVLDMGIARVSLEDWSVMTRIY